MTVAESIETRRELPKDWRTEKLGKLCLQDRRIIEPGTSQSAELPYLSLEHVESNTGRILREPSDVVEDEGKSVTFAFDHRHVLYGKLRPYLNKVALPHFAGRCTTEAIPLLPRDGVDRHFLAWVLRRQETVDAAMREKTGSRMPRADMEDLLNLEVPLPPLPEQRRIAAILNEQMAAVERARAAAEARLEAARALPAAYLREVFESEEARGWPKRKLGAISTLLPAHSIATQGDATVQAITTACLTEAGFDPAGIKIGRMRSEDAQEALVRPGEVLIARSNTPQLVGRVARYTGTPPGVVASDLTIRIWPSSDIDGRFLTFYLSSLFLSGYWQEHAGGASGSMKKITRSQLIEIAIPCPDLPQQQEVAALLEERLTEARRSTEILRSQLSTVEALPAALLRQAFNGEL